MIRKKHALGQKRVFARDDPRAETGFPSGQTRSVCPKIIPKRGDEVMILLIGA